MSLILDGSNGVTFPNSTVQASAGSVLQVVNATFTTQVSSSTSTFADLGLTATITPKFSTSKILVFVDLTGCRKDSNNTAMMLKLLRGSTSILQFEDNAGRTGSTATSGWGSESTSYLDNPATTSATTYKIQFGSYSNNASVTINDSAAGNLSCSTMTLMEIA
jgi:hypothetical protein